MEDRKRITGSSVEELARRYFPPAQTPEILDYIGRKAKKSEEGYSLEKVQIMSIMGWDPRELDWEYLKREGMV